MLIQGNALHIPLKGSSVHLIVTSPPYANARSYARWENYHNYLDDMKSAMSECYRVLCDGGRIAVNIVQGYGRPGSNIDGYYPLGHKMTDLIEEVGFDLRGIIVWSKPRHVMGTAWGSWKSATNPSLRGQHEIIIVAHKGRAKRAGGESTIDKDTFLKATSSIWVIPPKTNSWHPAPFPAEIPRRLIELYSFRGDTVLDPFSGSGTVARTAFELERTGIGIDIMREYCIQASQHLPQSRLPLFEDTE